MSAEAWAILIAGSAIVLAIGRVAYALDNRGAELRQINNHLAGIQNSLDLLRLDVQFMNSSLPWVRGQDPPPEGLLGDLHRTLDGWPPAKDERSPP